MAVSLPHTAITSWSGFVYQGKVAVLHCIKLLTSNNQVNGLYLQLDSVEDFAIINNGVFQSVHQVKAKIADTFGSYAEDFGKLKNKALKENCTNAFFHTSVLLRDENNELPNYAPAKMYEYNNKTWCSLGEIDDSIVESLCKYYRAHFPNDTWKDENYCESNLLPRLELLIAANVIDTHSRVQSGEMGAREAAYNNTIPFDHIHEILTKDHNDTSDKTYFLYRLKICFNKYYEEYCFDKSLDGDAFDKLSTYILYINSLSSQSLVKFYQTIVPHRNFKFQTITQFKDSTFTKDEIKNVFFTILERLINGEIDKYSIKWEKDSRIFFPTSIDQHQDFQHSVCRDILSNFHADDVKMLFNCDCLITYSMQTDSIYESAMHLIDSHETNNTILDVKKIALVPLEEAEEIINE